MSHHALRNLTTAGCIAIGLALAGARSIGFAAGVRTVTLKDQCDPASFNAAIGPDTCTGHNGGVPFDTFIQELTQTEQAGAWHIAPGEVRIRDGEAVQAQNIGGEVHTFTEVDEFGGGIIPLLNTLSGNPVPAPECLTLGPNDFVAPGQATAPDAEEPGVHHYQCCIHPWMRADIVVR
jgi:plastocyanin